MTQDSRIQVQILQTALAQQFKVAEDDVEVLDWSTEAGSAFGEGFACDMVSVKGKAKIRDQTEEFSFMSKLAPLSQKRMEMFKQVRRALSKGYWSSDIDANVFRWALLKKSTWCMESFCHKSSKQERSTV